MQKIINGLQDIKSRNVLKEELDAVLKKKSEKLQVSAKYLLKFGRQENSMTHFDYATQSVNKIQQRTGQRITSFPSTRKVTSESLRTTEA